MINASDKKNMIFSFTSISLALLFIFVSFVYASQEELEEVDHAIKGKGAHWVAGETSVSKLSPEERRARLPAHKPVSMENQSSTLQAPPFGATAPSSLDWRNYNSYYFVTPVRNQGSCGSCWAFATTAALESFILVAQDTPGVNLDTSEQTLVSCGSAGNCSGGYIDSASNYIVNAGLPLETCFPYTAANTSCSNACLDYQANTYRISKWHWVATNRPTVDAIKNALNTYGPLVTTMDVYSDFFYYATGIYTYVSGTLQGGHAILIVGYDDTQQYFIAKNSWGTGWGEAGFFKIGYSELNSPTQFGFYTIAYDQNQPSPPPPACTYSISPSSKSFDSSGGTGSVSVSTQSGCVWTAASNNPDWITIQGNTNSTGNGTVSYSASANSTTSNRTGSMTIAGQVFTVTESSNTPPPPSPAPTCTYTLSPSNKNFSSSGGTGSVSVSTQSGCTWTVVNNNSDWITTQVNASGTGNGTVSYSVSPNSSASSRKGSMTIAGQTFTVTESGVKANNNGKGRK